MQNIKCNLLTIGNSKVTIHDGQVVLAFELTREKFSVIALTVPLQFTRTRTSSKKSYMNLYNPDMLS